MAIMQNEDDEIITGQGQYFPAMKDQQQELSTPVFNRYPRTVASILSEILSSPFCVLPCKDESTAWGTARYLRNERYTAEVIDMNGGAAVLVRSVFVKPSTMRYTVQRLAALLHTVYFLTDQGKHWCGENRTDSGAYTFSRPSHPIDSIFYMGQTVYFV